MRKMETRKMNAYEHPTLVLWPTYRTNEQKKQPNDRQGDQNLDFFIAYNYRN